MDIVGAWEIRGEEGGECRAAVAAAFVVGINSRFWGDALYASAISFR